MSGPRILGDRDVNAALADGQAAPAKGVKSMEYHRQVFQSRIVQEPTKQYISPSDTIMSPCTAKLSALRNKQVTKYVPSITEPDIYPAPEKLPRAPSITITYICRDNEDPLESARSNKLFISRAKPKSLFAQASTKKLHGENPFGVRAAAAAPGENPLGARSAQSEPVLKSRLR
ncbi:hypothetical protein CCMA1212_003933 [Trichoderma ghanense]|uniref:Uncharacterized protein n=1 Tax=Trichoderma ghanense TaxID=65468 RepID=A0ABY2H856_9HYPO